MDTFEQNESCKHRKKVIDTNDMELAIDLDVIVLARDIDKMSSPIIKQAIATASGKFTFQTEAEADNTSSKVSFYETSNKENFTKSTVLVVSNAQNTTATNNKKAAYLPWLRGYSTK